MKINLLYLSALSFILVSTTAISQSIDNSVLAKVIYPKIYEKNFSQIPILKEGVVVPQFSAQSVVAVDMVSGITLLEKDPNKRLLPASTTKIITALVVLDNYSLDQVVEVSGIKVEGQKMGLLKGEKILVRNLLDGLLIYSANDAAEVLAMSHPLGRDYFIDLMNEKAKNLGLSNTHFSNPSGLDNGSQYVTARDLMIAAKYAMKNPVFASIVGTKEKKVASVDGRIVHRLANINKLLGSVDGVLGVKTGWTESARENLITEIDRDGKKIMIVVLGSSDRFGETKQIIDWIFANFEWQEVRPIYQF